MRILYRKLFRDIVGARGQAAAVAAVVLCGTAVYVTMASAHRNLLLTRDAYYSEYRLADFWISVERAPQTAVYRLEALPGVREARGRIVQDVNLDIPGQDGPRTGRLVSMPDHREPVLNDLVLMSGRYFTSGRANEVILSDAFAAANALEPGDTFQANIENRKHTLHVVGTALSPEYVYTIRGGGELVPDAKAFGILWVPDTFAEQALKMQGARNDFVGTVDDPARLGAILDRAEDVLDDYGVFVTVERKDQTSNLFLSSEIQGLGVTARVLPAVFLGVAAAVLLVLLNRMVRQERTQVGLLKAYGYSNLSVAGHYVRFALVLAVAGCVLGVVVGQWLALQIMKVYQEFYSFPLLRARVYPGVVVNAAGLTLGFSVLGALSAARRAARIHPAEAMRPESPRTGSRTLTERIEALWSRLSFTWKMIVRNVARYKLRASFTVAGVALSAAMLVIGRFSSDAMDYLIDFQFRVTQREDVRVMLASERGKAAWREFGRLEGVRRAEPLLQYPFEARHGWREKDVSITGVLPGSELLRLVDTEGRPVAIDRGGLVIDEKLADDLDAGPGDVLTLKPLMGRVENERRVVVSRVVEQYLGMGAYMDLRSLSRLLEEPFAMNAALLRTERGAERDVARELRDVAAVSGVTVKQDAYRSLMDTLGASMQISNAIIAIFASVIAFAIIYNTTTVSLMERRRELASLRVLGFSTREVGRILYNENALLSALGLLLGIPLGLGLCRLLVEAYETELYRFPFHFEYGTVVYTAAMTVLFVGVANWAVHRKVRRLDIVEVLKARE